MDALHTSLKGKYYEKIKDNAYKDIAVGYTDNHTRDTYKFYNPETKRAIMTRDIHCAEWKMIEPAETMKLLCDLNK